MATDSPSQSLRPVVATAKHSHDTAIDILEAARDVYEQFLDSATGFERWGYISPPLV